MFGIVDDGTLDSAIVIILLFISDPGILTGMTGWHGGTVAALGLLAGSAATLALRSTGLRTVRFLGDADLAWQAVKAGRPVMGRIWRRAGAVALTVPQKLFHVKH